MSGAKGYAESAGRLLHFSDWDFHFDLMSSFILLRDAISIFFFFFFFFADAATIDFRCLKRYWLLCWCRLFSAALFLPWFYRHADFHFHFSLRHFFFLDWWVFFSLFLLSSRDFHFHWYFMLCLIFRLRFISLRWNIFIIAIIFCFIMLLFHADISFSTIIFSRCWLRQAAIFAAASLFFFRHYLLMIIILWRFRLLPYFSLFSRLLFAPLRRAILISSLCCAFELMLRAISLHYFHYFLIDWFLALMRWYFIDTWYLLIFHFHHRLWYCFLIDISFDWALHADADFISRCFRFRASTFDWFDYFRRFSLSAGFRFHRYSCFFFRFISRCAEAP